MTNSRRTFLKIASLSFLGFAGGRVFSAAAAETEKSPGSAVYRDGKEALKAGHWGMVIDTRRFDSLEKFQAVIDACHRYHNVPKIDSKKEVKGIWQDGYRQAFTDQMDNYPANAVSERRYLLLCNHCANPACVRVCPTGATFRLSDGIVVMDYHRCIGCRYCMAACPFGARSFNFEDPRLAAVNPSYPRRERGVVEKCTFCAERLAEGKLPLCVEAAEGAIAFGDLTAPASSVRALLAENFAVRRKPELVTEPGVYYIL